MLPKSSNPIYKIELPILKKKFNFRPFLVKEERLLLIAKESEDSKDILSAVKQIVNNCSLSKDFDTNKITICDLEYIFLRLRAYSVDNIVKMTYIDSEDNKQYNFEVDLNNVKVKFPEKADKNIKITDNNGIILKYPDAGLYEDDEFLSIDKDYMFELIARCIDSIYVGEEIYKSSEYTLTEIKEYLESLDVKTYTKIEEFLVATPTIEHIIEYKNSFGNDRKIVLKSLNDFFTWR